ncbi:MAG TPA: acyl carrier protein [Kofleriaceae bacterium]|jgi:acyl carrier protein|nr:acyl carrier protein [Kofleriaceae bacterium]
MRNFEADSEDQAARDIEVFLRERFQIADDDTVFSRRVNLFNEGYVDSVGVIEMIAFLEDRFRVKLPEDVVFSADFTNIAGIARYVVRLRAG